MSREQEPITADTARQQIARRIRFSRWLSRSAYGVAFIAGALLPQHYDDGLGAPLLLMGGGSIAIGIDSRLLKRQCNGIVGALERNSNGLGNRNSAETWTVKDGDIVAETQYDVLSSAARLRSVQLAVGTPMKYFGTMATNGGNMIAVSAMGAPEIVNKVAGVMLGGTITTAAIGFGAIGQERWLNGAQEIYDRQIANLEGPTGLNLPPTP